VLLEALANEGQIGLLSNSEAGEELSMALEARLANTHRVVSKKS